MTQETPTTVLPEPDPNGGGIGSGKGTQDGGRRYWKAVVRTGNNHRESVGGSERHDRITWHAASCAAPFNECEGCEP